MRRTTIRSIVGLKRPSSAVALQLAADLTSSRARARLTSEQQGGHVAPDAGETWLVRCERGSTGSNPLFDVVTSHSAALGKSARPRKEDSKSAARVSRLQYRDERQGVDQSFDLIYLPLGRGATLKHCVLDRSSRRGRSGETR